MAAPKALVIGTGYVGGEVVEQLREKGYSVLTGRRSDGSDVHVDLNNAESIKALESAIPDGVDHVVAVAGHSSFGDISKFDSKSLVANYENKLITMTRLAVMLVNEEVKLLRDGGSITLTSGLAARSTNRNWPAVSANCAGIDAFTRCAGIDAPRGVRINAVALTLVTETAIAAGKPTENTVPAAQVASRFVESITGTASGEVFTCGDPGAPKSFGAEVFEHLHKKQRKAAEA
mmetsp:Transcript_67062/g.155647  ORF Transcript_67062/g.155647 Transcript_67062/m.155647 type:complete len:233 (+) Transcript_67062:44-742(+)